MTAREQDGEALAGSIRSDLELLRLARLEGEYGGSTTETVRRSARNWLEGSGQELTSTDSAYLVEALFKSGLLSEAGLVSKKRGVLLEPQTAFDELVQQYQRLANYDLALPPRQPQPPMFPPVAPPEAPRVLSLYHTSIGFQKSGYSVRTQALLSNSKLDVVPLTRIGYPWAAKLPKAELPKGSKDKFETEYGGVRYQHRRGQVMKQSLIFSNLALSKHEILKTICETRPNVVHAASNFVNALPGLLAARASGLPFVYEMRGLWELTAGVGIPTWLGSERYELERRTETFVAMNSDQVIVLSEVQKRELVSRGIEAERVRVVINGHEPHTRAELESEAVIDEHCPGLREWLAGRTAIGYAGAIAVYEGLQELLAVLAKRRDAWTGVALVVAGDGPYLPHLRSLVSQLGLESHVKLLGRIPANAVNALYRVVDLCVLPRLPDLVSQLITPLKTVEILAQGKVLLASNVGAIAEQLDRYGYGETFVAGDQEDLARQLDRILNNLPSLKARYAGASGRISEQFSWGSIAAEWDRLLTEVAQDAAASQSALAPCPAFACRALTPLYDERPERRLEPLRAWRRVARVQLWFSRGRSIYVRSPANLELRLIALPDGGEIGHDVALGPAQGTGPSSLRELLPMPQGKYTLFVYVEWNRASLLDSELAFLQSPKAGQPHEMLDVVPVKREVRQLLAFEIKHDAKNPAELNVLSEHAGATRVALSYIPLPGAELGKNFDQRTRSKVTGTRFHYVSLEEGSSELALFPRLSGPLIVEMTPWADGEILENRIRQVCRVQHVPRDASLFASLDRSRTNILVAANINETLLDGSTIWLKTLVNTLASLPGVNVYVATNALLVSNGVTAELFDKPNVAKIDILSTSSDRRSDIAKQLAVLDRTSGGFDLFIVRGLDFARAIVTKATRDRCVYYGAGMFARAPDGTVVTDEPALQIAAKSAAVIFQNQTMERLFRQREPAYEGQCYCIPPSVEQSALESTIPSRAQKRPEKLVVYAGKLIRAYGVVELVEAVCDLIESGTPVRLVVLGNKFDKRDPDYQERFESATARLGQAVTWLPAVAPSVALRWVAQADVVWGWRHGEFENSHFEVSTKMIEAIGCATPIVLYPAVANRELMGDAYPGFGHEPAAAAEALARLLSVNRDVFQELFASLKPRFIASQAYRPLLDNVVSRVRPTRHHAGARGARPSILIAGHDFRFIENVEARLLAQGSRVTREYWKGHSTRLEYGQANLVAEADIILCEWCLGNAVWWSRNLPQSKRLFIRLHLQELSTTYPAAVDFSRVEKILFVSPHVMREAIAKFDIPADKCKVVPISVRLNTAPSYSETELLRRRNTLGMVGLTPWRKRPDRALELLLGLRERYPNLTLHLKGHTPSEYAWMAHRREELQSYQHFFREIARLERLGVVRVSGYDDQLESFYREAGWILSLSDFEGCHTAVAEGGVMGCLPLMTNWAGASEIYPANLVQRDNAGLVRFFDAHYPQFESESRSLQAQFTRTFGIDRVFEQWCDLFFQRQPLESFPQQATLIPPLS